MKYLIYSIPFALSLFFFSCSQDTNKKNQDPTAGDKTEKEEIDLSVLPYTKHDLLKEHYPSLNFTSDSTAEYTDDNDQQIQLTVSKIDYCNVNSKRYAFAFFENRNAYESGFVGIARYVKNPSDDWVLDKFVKDCSCHGEQGNWLSLPELVKVSDKMALIKSTVSGGMGGQYMASATYYDALTDYHRLFSHDENSGYNSGDMREYSSVSTITFEGELSDLKAIVETTTNSWFKTNEMSQEVFSFDPQNRAFVSDKPKKGEEEVWHEPVYLKRGIRTNFELFGNVKEVYEKSVVYASGSGVRSKRPKPLDNWVSCNRTYDSEGRLVLVVNDESQHYSEVFRLDLWLYQNFPPIQEDELRYVLDNYSVTYNYPGENVQSYSGSDQYVKYYYSDNGKLNFIENYCLKESHRPDERDQVCDRIVFEYEEYGRERLITKDVYNYTDAYGAVGDDRLVYKTKYTWDDYDRVSKKAVFYGNGDRYVTIRYKKDAEGNIQREIQTDFSDSDPQYKHHKVIPMVYDAYGRLVSKGVQKKDRYGEFMEEITYKYENGLLTEINEPDKGLLRPYSMTYDEYGNITSLSNPAYHPYKKWEYSYDEFGNWIERKQFDVKKGDIELSNLEYVTTRQIQYH